MVLSLLIKHTRFPKVGWDVLRLRMFYSWDVLELRHFRVGTFWSCDVLRLVGTFWGLGRFIAGTFWGWDILYVDGT